MKKNIVIAIDGPAGAGKSTLGKKLADHFGFLYIDTGAMYRAFTLKCLRMEVPPEDDEKISALLEETDIRLEQHDGILKVFLDDEEVSGKIRTPEVGRSVSAYSAVPLLREKMVALQRRMGEEASVVMDGRDIGTVVFPDADLKIYLDASTKTRAARRYKEIEGKNTELDAESDEFKSVMRDQIARDKTDSRREKSPLKPAEDAVIIDSSEMTIDEVFKTAVELVKKIK